MDRKLQAMLHTDDQTTPTIFDGGIRCPKSNGGQHMAMVVAWTVMDLDDDPEGDEPGNSIPCRAICATCKHDWDPREDHLFEPCDFCEVKAGEKCLEWCDCRSCKEAA